jgi:hypothetical protein
MIIVKAFVVIWLLVGSCILVIVDLLGILVVTTVGYKFRLLLLSVRADIHVAIDSLLVILWESLLVRIGFLGVFFEECLGCWRLGLIVMGVACIWVFDEVLAHVLALFETLLVDLHWSSNVAHDHASLTVVY